MSFVKTGDKHGESKRLTVSTKWGPLAVTAAVFLTVVLYMGLWRGIWFDELLHFAFGGMTLEYALRTIDYSTIHVNHGQTGAYFLVDWGLLQVFGANAVALRSPSWISAALMLASAAVFIRAKGFGWFWATVAVLALGANETLMFYAGEARPYMVMAASATAMLAFYALDLHQRRRWWARFLAVFGFIVGSVMHPYWVVLWVIVAVFSAAVFIAQQKGSLGFRSVWSFLSPFFWIPGVVLYLSLSQLTWMRRFLNFGWPDSIYAWPSLANSFLQNHFSFAPYFYPPRVSTAEFNAGIIIPLVVGGFVLLTVIWLILFPRVRNWSLLPPILLFTLASGSTFFFSYLSVRSQYIIFERQWVAGMALSAVALTWFFAEWHRAAVVGAPYAVIPSAVFVTFVAVSFAISIFSQTAITVDRFHSWKTFEQESRSIDELVAQATDAESYKYDPSSPEEGYGYLANVNIARGGPVWEVFVAWYNKESGMRQEFRAKDNNWTDWIWPNPSPQSFLCLPERLWQCPVQGEEQPSDVEGH